MLFDCFSYSSLVSWMLAQMEQSDMLALMQQQKDDEDEAVDKMDSSDEEEEEEEEDEDEDEEEEEVEDEEDEDKVVDEKEDQEKENGSYLSSTKNRKRLSGKEKNFLREQFVNDMYWSFLEGKDKDFDYRLVLWE